MGYIAIHTLSFPNVQRPSAVGKPEGIPSNTIGDIKPRPFHKIHQTQVPVTKLVIRRQINT